MKLLKLSLTNFKSIRQSSFEFDGENKIIFGDNATGKTTVFDSMCWLLFGKDSLDRSDFEIKTLVNGEPIHKVNHEVEGEFSNDDGTQFTLKRVYREKYSNPRGGDTKLTGHTTDYFINDVPVKEKEYKAYINNLISDDVFKLITNPLYFNEQYSWQNRRKLLLEMCGDVDDETVIRNHGELRKLLSILNGRTVEEHKKIVAAKKAAINKELDMIPVRIDEAIRNKPEVQSDKDKLKADIETFNTGINQLEEEAAVIKNGLKETEVKSKIRSIKRTIDERRNQVLSDYDKEKTRLRSEYEFALKKLKSIEQERDRLADHNYETGRDIERENKRIEKLKEEFNVFNAQEFDDVNCPTCGQPYPDDKREDLKEAFNMQKATNLEEWQKLIDGAENMKRSYIEQEEIVAVKIDGLTNQVEEQQQDYERKFKAYEELEQPDINKDSIYMDLQAQLFLLESELDDTDTTNSYKAINKDIDEMKAKRTQLVDELNKHELIETIDERVKELERKQQQLANDKNELDEAMFLMDEFIKAKVDMLEQSINSHFEYARFKMFNVLVNGNIEECCETTYKGVPYRSMNNAARMNVGLDIINALTKFYNVTAPVFIDNAEAVTNFIHCHSQVIQLFVDATFKELTVA
jgi:DNA repair exonuclease SbcCD ATPase subunit|nr:MAG TPA: chromosome partition protein [Caudoviricetes sp.]